jgi:hypothetical protein
VQPKTLLTPTHLHFTDFKTGFKKTGQENGKKKKERIPHSNQWGIFLLLAKPMIIMM